MMFKNAFVEWLRWAGRLYACVCVCLVPKSKEGIHLVLLKKKKLTRLPV